MDCIYYNLDPQITALSMPGDGFFHTHAGRATIINYFKNVISGYFHPQYSKHVIVGYHQANDMLGLIVMQVDIGVDEKYESGTYFCRFGEDVTLATSSSMQCICQNVSVGVIMVPLSNSNEDF